MAVTRICPEHASTEAAGDDGVHEPAGEAATSFLPVPVTTTTEMNLTKKD